MAFRLVNYYVIMQLSHDDKFSFRSLTHIVCTDIILSIHEHSCWGVKRLADPLLPSKPRAIEIELDAQAVVCLLNSNSESLGEFAGT